MYVCVYIALLTHHMYRSQMAFRGAVELNYMQNARLKRKVLRCDLKRQVFDISLSLAGSVLHVVLGALLKLRSPKLFLALWVLATRCCDDERS